MTQNDYKKLKIKILQERFTNKRLTPKELAVDSQMWHTSQGVPHFCQLKNYFILSKRLAFTFTAAKLLPVRKSVRLRFSGPNLWF